MFDDKKMKIKDFREMMLHEIFTETNVPNLSWLALFSRFARRHVDSYVSFDKIHKQEADYNALLVNCFLLGLDIHLVMEKNRLRAQDMSLNEAIKSIEKDPALNEYFNYKEDASLQEQFFIHEIERLEQTLKAFQVSDNYHEMQKKADALHAKKKELENDRVLKENTIHRIQESMEESEMADYKSAYRIYEIAKIEIPESMRNSIDKVNAFHSALLESRKTRLNKDLQRSFKETMDKRGVNIDELTQKFSKMSSEELAKIKEQLANAEKVVSEKLKKADEAVEEFAEKAEEKIGEVSEAVEEAVDKAADAAEAAAEETAEPAEECCCKEAAEEAPAEEAPAEECCCKEAAEEEKPAEE